MIERLKFLIDEFENKPKLKEVLLKVASLPENRQEEMLNLIEIIVHSMVNKNETSQ
jgi:hypothetical protein